MILRTDWLFLVAGVQFCSDGGGALVLFHEYELQPDSSYVSLNLRLLKQVFRLDQGFRDVFFVN
jgi:hypothetical protein